MIKNFLNWFKRLFGFPSGDGMRTVLEMVAHTQEQEITCDDLHALIDQFAEMKMRGEDPTRFMPFVQQHLDMCPDCRAEYESLLEALRIERQIQG